MKEVFNLDRCIGLYKIREILLHMVFQININVRNVLHMKKRVHAKPREAFKNRKE